MPALPTGAGTVAAVVAELPMLVIAAPPALGPDGGWKLVTAAPLLPAGKLLLMPLMGPLIAAPVDVGVPGPMQHTHTHQSAILMMFVD